MRGSGGSSGGAFKSVSIPDRDFSGLRGIPYPLKAISNWVSIPDRDFSGLREFGFDVKQT